MWQALTVSPGGAEGLNGSGHGMRKRGSWSMVGGAGSGRRDRARRGYSHH